jgi:hypothetical protein
LEFAIAIVVVGLAALPFYVFVLAKCAASGWAAGTISYLSYTRRKQSNGKESIHEFQGQDCL